ncbi:hypothetical protein [Sporichthya sp.]|uniref:hypothetical protein n=1 Tax=Sporichthya sp. TaxID=65475 RepID=UPI0017B8AF14|nr:hypothetical protein [Sporichthya sp.]MBA3741619.1 DUF2933 domain-containing protein [Sporichthya sp.]
MVELLRSLAILACPVGMGAMMWFMMRGRGGSSQTAPAQVPANSGELARLRAEIDQLQAAQRDANPKASPR